MPAARACDVVLAQPIHCNLLRDVVRVWLTLSVALVAGEPLEGFLPDAETVKRLQPVIEQLESDSFAQRETASRELAMLPALPGWVRQLAATEPRAESRIRLRELAAAFPIARENERLTGILQGIARESIQGQLDALCRVMACGIWTPDDQALHAAARATVTAADLSALDALTENAAAVQRRIAAAGLSGLPSRESTARLASLADDADPLVVILAATELAARRDVRALPAFARLLDERDFEVRYRCHAALRALTGKDFDYDPAADGDQRVDAAVKWRQWAGSTAAAITGSMPKDSAIVLFNGRGLQGWEFRLGHEDIFKSEGWQIVDGQLRCSGKWPGDLWTKNRFDNFILNLEYFAPTQHSDSGVGLLLTEKGEQAPQPEYLEVQLLPNKGGDFYQIGGCAVEANGKPIQFQAPRLAEVKDNFGDWHRLKLTVCKGTVEVELDGVIVNRSSKGPTAPGRIVLRNEGSDMVFRNLLLHPLPAGR